MKTINITRNNWTLVFLIVSFLFAGCDIFSNDDDNKHGSDVVFGDDITDVDGNKYRTVIIGNQEWMAENLRTTKYNDGSSIPIIVDNNTWINLESDAYCWYGNNKESSDNDYGAIYNWYAVNTGKLCPAGWHVPTDDEWSILVDYVGDFSNAGGKLKETGFDHWENPNVGATNEHGFSALPAGRRIRPDGEFFGIGTHCLFWSSSDDGESNGYCRGIYAVNERVNSYGFNKVEGMSVRCIKD
jgi:uncharacterized protein (TIGR02145 family)